MESELSQLQQEDEKLTILSQIWILSCNDEIPEMTYRGIKFRLYLADDYPVEEIIRKRGELFREKIPTERLVERRADMLNNIGVSSWIRAYKTKEEQENVIKGLRREDFFRNQFRLEKKAKRCPLSTLDWGLKHIERLRQINTERIERLREIDTETREEKNKRMKEIYLPFISTMVAFVLGIATISITGYMQNQGFAEQRKLQAASLERQEKLHSDNLKAQEKLKYDEIYFEPKHTGYFTLIKHLDESYNNAKNNNLNALTTSMYNVEAITHQLEPFFIGDKENIAEKVRAKLTDTSDICNKLLSCPKQSPEREEYRKMFVNNKEEIKRLLKQILFNQTPDIIEKSK